MSTPVEKFIRDTHTQFNVQYSLTSEQVRRFRYKLAAADIQGDVKKEDENLARDIILKDYDKSSKNLRTASATNSGIMAHSIRNAGTCPRCQQGMTFTRLAEADEIKYCANCHVCVPVE